MCGIAGIFSNSLDNKKIINKSVESLHPRGPDDSGIIELPDNNFMAHTRLSIIGLSKRFKQPYSLDNKNYLVFNGEIFNYKELSQQYNLKNLDSDTHILYELIHKYNVADILKSINGFFSFAYYDNYENKLYCARDPFGVKPLYYFHDKNTFYFKSDLFDIKSIFDNITVNHKSILEFLDYKYIKSNNSIYNNIYKLPAGSMLEYDINKEEIKIINYFDYDSDYKFDNQETELEYFNDLKNSVKSRLVSDVKVSVALSGGLDSSIISAIIKREFNYDIESFTLVFPDSNKFNEEKKSDNFCRAFGIKQNKVRFNNSFINHFFENIHKYIDEPFGDQSIIPSFQLYEYISNTHKVVLTGDGGDEFNYGYSRYEKYKIIYKYINYVKYLNFIKDDYFEMLGVNIDKLRKLSLSKNYSDFYANASKIFYFSPSSEEKYTRFNDDKVGPDFDIKYWLPNNINKKTDSCSMKFSIESREPLLDKSLYKYRYCNAGNPKKYLNNILNNTYKYKYKIDKKGFNTPDNFINELCSNTGKAYLIDSTNALLVNNKNKITKLQNVSQIWTTAILTSWLDNNK